MKDFTIILSLLMSFNISAICQASFTVEINPIHPPFAVTNADLKEANTLTDLNVHYKEEWVKSYHSVLIRGIIDGDVEEAKNLNANFTIEQKALLSQADPGTDIEIIIDYLPENNLSNNTPKQMDFTLKVIPPNQASFRGGKDALAKYLKKYIEDKIDKSQFEEYQLASVKFTVNSKGLINNPTLFWSSEDQETDQILIEGIENMPPWLPASFNSELQVAQTFALTVGDMRSCVVNSLNITRDADKK